MNCELETPGCPCGRCSQARRINGGASMDPKDYDGAFWIDMDAPPWNDPLIGDEIEAVSEGGYCSEPLESIALDLARAQEQLDELNEARGEGLPALSVYPAYIHPCFTTYAELYADDIIHRAFEDMYEEAEDDFRYTRAEAVEAFRDACSAFNKSAKAVPWYLMDTTRYIRLDAPEEGDDHAGD